MRSYTLISLLVSFVLFGLSACHSPEKPLNPPGLRQDPAATPFPTPAAAYSGADLAERLALLESIQPQPGVVANSRPEALVQVHDFIEAYSAALEDGSVSLDELDILIQRSATARASLYSTGQPEMIHAANTAGWLIDLAIYGDWEAASVEIHKFQRSLPRKPNLD